jgi:hypothetical protein
MTFRGLTAVEKIILLLAAVAIATGILLFYTDVPRFQDYVKEDGIAEWLTVVGLLLGSFVCLSRFVLLLRKRPGWFLFVTLALGLFLFFAAGEEISWGQRIFGLKTPEYFQEHNAQQETNLHNLVVDGVKLNKLIFSILLVGLLAIFLLIVPLLYQKNKSVRTFLDRSAVPVPQFYQVLAFVIVFVLTNIIRDGKNAELLECCGALLFFLIVRYPKNREIFSTHKAAY